jgi:ferritin
MLSKTLEGALNDQIKNELYSAYLYLSMAAYCDSINLSGFARWLRLQYEEEVSHAMKFFDHINDRGGRVILQAIDQPPSDFKSPLQVFENVLEHERKVTGMINKLYELAFKENDYPAQVMLQWFIEEQVEEEKTAGEIIEQLKLIGEQGSALLMLDRQLSSREG